MNTKKQEFKVFTNPVDFAGRNYLNREVTKYLSDKQKDDSTLIPKAELKLSLENQDEYLLYYKNKVAGKIEKRDFINISLKEIDVLVTNYSTDSYTIILLNEDEIMQKKRDNELKLLNSLTDEQKQIINICKKNYFFSDEDIQNLCNYWKSLPNYCDITTHGAKIANLKDITLYDDTKEEKVILHSFISIFLNKSIWYSGPASCGKNIAAITLLCILQQPYIEISVNEYSNSDDFLGSETIENKEVKNTVVSNIIFKQGPLVEAVENGYICVFDEFNAASSGLFPLFNSLTDTRRTINVPKYKFLEAHKHFNLILTCNEEYAGTNFQNIAFLSRFNKFCFNYPLSIKNHLKSKLSEKINNLYKAVREKVCSENEENDKFCFECLFIRCYKAFDEMIFLGAEPKSALKICLINKIPRSEDANAVYVMWTNLL